MIWVDLDWNDPDDKSIGVYAGIFFGDVRMEEDGIKPQNGIDLLIENADDTEADLVIQEASVYFDGHSPRIKALENLEIYIGDDPTFRSALKHALEAWDAREKLLES